MAPREVRVESNVYTLARGRATPALAKKLQTPDGRRPKSAQSAALGKQAVRQAVADRAAREEKRRRAQCAFVMVEVLDADDQPVANVKFRAIDGLGEAHEGTTDAKGCATIETLAAGDACDITFPDFDGNDWWLDSEGPPQPKPKVFEQDFLEFVVLDDSNEPVEGLGFVAIDANGTRHEGTVGAGGKVRLDAVAKGEVDLTFPEIDAAEWAGA